MQNRYPWFLVREMDRVGQVKTLMFYAFPPKLGDDPNTRRKVLDVVELSPEESTKPIKELEGKYALKRLKAQQTKDLFL